MPKGHRHFHGNTKALLTRSRLLWVLLFKLLMLINVSVPCPSKCRCLVDIGLVHCDFLSLQGILEDVPQWVRNLSLVGSDVNVLRPETFQRNGTQLSNLTTLLLINSSIQAIEALAFQELPSLTTLDLSFNRLTAIADDAFDGASQLKVLKLNQAFQAPAVKPLLNSHWTKPLGNLNQLELTGNALHSIPNLVFHLENLETVNIGNNAIKRFDEDTILNLSFKKQLGLYLSPNSFVCDCRMTKGFLWLRNSSQALDAQSLKCYAPSSLNGTEVMSLKIEDFKCINEDLETASYVFFGIVLALIGVIFLMVLYLNRKGIKRWLNNIREACRDQMEGYHYRYEQDSDPRRSNASIGI
ncbi:trophoblast glycoprotein-like [Xenopus laevis]|uniref:Trophoblast glycoprotein-like n=1 Tax=Xenopus laevis TaxID=8355 RepID=A0A8J1MBI4_XENLA|nr:trophoblast glycoprotein-like [Xenopus laevis]